MDTAEDRLRWLLETSGVTQSEAAALTALSEMTIMFIATGRRRNPEADTASAMAKVFGCSAWWFMTGEGDAPPADAVRAAVAASRERHPAPHTGPSIATGTAG